MLHFNFVIDAHLLSLRIGPSHEKHAEPNREPLHARAAAVSSPCFAEEQKRTCRIKRTHCWQSSMSMITKHVHDAELRLCWVAAALLQLICCSNERFWREVYQSLVCLYLSTDSATNARMCSNHAYRSTYLISTEDNIRYKYVATGIYIIEVL